MGVVGAARNAHKVVYDGKTVACGISPQELQTTLQH